MTALLLLALWALPADSTYELKLGRPIKPSDSYLWTTTVETVETHRLSAPNGPTTDSTMHLRIRISAMVNVISVTAEGEEHEKTLTIRNCSVEHNGRSIDLLPTGSLIRATFTAQGTQLMLNNRRMPDSIIAYIGSAIRAEGGEKTKRIMDAGKPVRVRQTWPMNTKELVKLLDRSVVSVSPKDLKGVVSFELIDSTNRSQPTAGVVGTARATKLKFPAIKGVPVTDALLDVTASVVVPLDTRYPETRNVSDVRMAFNAKVPGPDGTPINYQWRVMRKQNSTFER